jgi:hypothetical protein
VGSLVVESNKEARAGLVHDKRADTVGELKSAEICGSNMPSLKAKKLRKLPREKVLLELCKWLANSITPFAGTGCGGVMCVGVNMRRETGGWACHPPQLDYRT